MRESVPLATLTTLRVGGPARYVIEIPSADDVVEALRFAGARRLPSALLGGGSNVLADDAGYEGVVLHMRIPGVTYTDTAEGVLVRVGAGVSWDELVRDVAARNLWGIENLAGIPGTVGAAPVQNIGAYGTEIRETLVAVEGWDAMTGEPFTRTNAACAFGYRDSLFKREPALVITHVTFLLRPEGRAQISYKDLAAAAAAGASVETPEEVGEMVRAIRSRKFPDIRVEGTAGSFFKNPVISKEAFSVLAGRYPDLPQYPVDDGVKVPLAYVLDKILNLRGYREGLVRLFEAQPLVLVAEDGATQREIDAFADRIAQKVFDATNITIEREVRRFA